MSWHKIADIFTWLRRKFKIGHFASTSAPSASSFHSCHWHQIGDCLPFFRLDENKYWYVQPDGPLETWLKAHQGNYDVKITDPSSRVIQVQGPASQEILSQWPIHSQFENFPTCSTCVIDFDLNDWSDLKFGIGTIRSFLVPKDLESIWWLWRGSLLFLKISAQEFGSRIV